MAEKKTPAKGDHVQWDSPQGEVEGTVVGKVTGIKKVKGHVAKASPDEPQFEVKSDKSGKIAIHKAEALKPAKAPRIGQKTDKN